MNLKGKKIICALALASAFFIAGAAIGCGGGDKMKTFTERYSSVKIVYDSYGRSYEKQAAEKARDFFNGVKENYAEIVESDEFSEKTGVYALYVGDVEKTDFLQKELNGEGYVIKVGDGYAAARGSNAEFTRHALSKLLYSVAESDPDKLISLCEKSEYTQKQEVNREEYIKDINKFPLVWEYEWKSPVWAHDFAEKTAEFKNPQGRVMVFGHRGDIECYPENSAEGFISAVRRGVDGIELDIWQSKDGVYVLNHDKSLAETTDWLVKKGKTVDGVKLPVSEFIFDWTYEQLRKLNLRSGNGEYSSASSEVTSFKITTLEEALIICKDRCYISMDRLNFKPGTTERLSASEMGINNPYWNDVYELMKKTGSFTALYLNMALTKSDADALRKIVDSEQNISTPTIFDRTGSHNCVNDWYAEFTCTDFNALYQKWITEGVFQGGGQTPAGTFILCNRPSKGIEFVDKKISS